MGGRNRTVERRPGERKRDAFCPLLRSGERPKARSLTLQGGKQNGRTGQGLRLRHLRTRSKGHQGGSRHAGLLRSADAHQVGTRPMKPTWRRRPQGSRRPSIVERTTISQLLPAIETRRAGRALSDWPIDRETADTLLHAAHLPPSCFNKQPWRLTAVDDPSALAAIKEAMASGNYCTRPSPLIVAVASRPRLRALWRPTRLPVRLWDSRREPDDSGDRRGADRPPDRRTQADPL
jgi:hypothetical protein